MTLDIENDYLNTVNKETKHVISFTVILSTDMNHVYRHFVSEPNL